MDSLLNQAEIDALLQQATDEGGGEIEGALAEMESEAPPAQAREAVPFDFSRPYSISRNFEKNLLSICENLAKAATVHFTTQFRANCGLEFRRLVLQTFAEYAANLPSPTCIAAVTLPPLKGTSLFHLDLPLSFAMLKKLLGGAAEAETRNREYTEIETSIVRSLVLKFLELFKGASARLVPLEPKFQALDNNPSYLSALAPGDSVVVLDYVLHLESVEGRLNFCLPIAGFEPVRALFDPEQSGEARPAAEVRRDRETVRDLLDGTTVEAVAKLAETTLTLEQILKLEDGQVLVLPKPVDAPLLLEIEGRPCFLAAAGRVRNHRALRLTGKCNEE